MSDICYPTPSADQLAAALKLRAESTARLQKREESFQRCDTDGFLSQWADGLSAQLATAKATILEHGGVAEFVGLFDKDTGARVPAKVIETKFGTSWMLCHPGTGRAIGVYYPTGANSRKQRQAGLEERVELAPAEAKTVSVGRGLSGKVSVAVVRTDGGWPGALRS